MSKLPLVKLKMPELKKHKVWVGAYGGHFDVVCLWHERPIKDKIFECYCNPDVTIALGSWDAWFGLESLLNIGLLDPENNRPFDVHCRGLRKIEIELPWYENDMIDLSFNAD